MLNACIICQIPEEERASLLTLLAACNKSSVVQVDGSYYKVGMTVHIQCIAYYYYYYCYVLILAAHASSDGAYMLILMPCLLTFR